MGSKRAYQFGLAVILASISSGLYAPPTLIDGGSFPDAISTRATCVSGDGHYVVGNSGGHMFRWSDFMGQPVLENIGDADPKAVNQDGSVVVGLLGNPTVSFRWTAATGIEPLAMPSGVTEST